jgi:hypothetical protein
MTHAIDSVASPYDHFTISIPLAVDGEGDSGSQGERFLRPFSLIHVSIGAAG